jgi:hypothetical protein
MPELFELTAIKVPVNALTGIEADIVFGARSSFHQLSNKPLKSIL